MPRRARDSYERQRMLGMLRAVFDDPWLVSYPGVFDGYFNALTFGQGDLLDYDLWRIGYWRGRRESEKERTDTIVRKIVGPKGSSGRPTRDRTHDRAARRARKKNRA